MARAGALPALSIRPKLMGAGRDAAPARWYLVHPRHKGTAVRPLFVADHVVIWDGVRALAERHAAHHQPGAPFQQFCARALAGPPPTAALALELLPLAYPTPATHPQRGTRCR